MSSTIVDPRPQAARSGVTGATITLSGWRCAACGHPSTQEVPRCPVCCADMEATTFATRGVVFASTCLRVRVPGHEPPFAMAYLVLDDHGPRVLVHSPGVTPLVPGARAEVTGVTEQGDLVATSAAEGSA